uniref:Integrin, alpha 1 n=1 Tax=Electrophorus electricus TaxID=8005 RepID=A0A4W4H060_ELEEL
MMSGTQQYMFFVFLVLLPCLLFFNVDEKNGMSFTGPVDDMFGYTVQQFENSEGKWVLDWFSSEGTAARKHDHGTTLVANPDGNGFLACGPQYGYMCGKLQYTTGICSNVSSSFKVLNSIAPTIRECQQEMDVVIVLDGSNSIYPWEEIRRFLVKFLKNIEIPPARVGIVSYGDDVGHELNLSQFSNTHDLIKFASLIPQRTGQKTMTALGIDTARREAFTTERGARPGVKKVMVIVTDGESHDHYNLKSVINECEKDGIERFAIAVLGDYNRQNKSAQQVQNFINEIKLIASEKKEDHFFNVEDELALVNISDTLGRKIFALEATSGNHTYSFEMEMSQAGFSAHTSRDGVMLGAVGAYDWNGTVVMTTGSEVVVPGKNTFHDPQKQKYEGMAAYVGYDVQSAYTPSGVLYITGAPRFNHSGRVTVYQLHDKSISVTQNLNGEQIGSYFGSVLQTLDVNGDSYTDLLLVGAPMYMGPERDEQGQVYVYKLNTEGVFDHHMTLKPVNQSCCRAHSHGSCTSENVNEPCGARFGTAIAAVPDLNLDGFNDVVIGAPLENDHRGAVYIYHGTQDTIRDKYAQRIAAGGDGKRMKFFGQSIHGVMDLNDDGIVDITIGGIGGAALYWSRDVAELHATMTFNVTKINLQQPSCEIRGKTTVCVHVTVCFTYNIKSEKETQPETVISYNLTLDSLRVIARGRFVKTDEKRIQRNSTITDHLCTEHEDLAFYMSDKLDFRDPLMVLLEFGLVDDSGPVLDGDLPTSVNKTVSPGLFLLCCYSLVIKASQEKFHISISVENRGDSAYNTKVVLSPTENINYVKVESKDKECEPDSTRVVCAVGYPFLKSNAKENFSVIFEVNPMHFRKDIVINITSSSDSEEFELSDNSEHISIPVKYETRLKFTVHKMMKEDHIIVKEGDTWPRVISNTSAIGDEMNISYMIEQDTEVWQSPLQLTVTFPYITPSNNKLLYLTHVASTTNIICQTHNLVNQLNISPQNPMTDTPKAETLSNFLVSCQEKANPCKSFSCFIPPNKFNQINATFRVWKSTFIKGEFSQFNLTVHAKLESKDTDLFQLSRGDEYREVRVEILKELRSGIPLWIIILSILIGLLILALVIFALWMVSTTQLHTAAHNTPTS